VLKCESCGVKLRIGGVYVSIVFLKVSGAQANTTGAQLRIGGAVSAK